MSVAAKFEFSSVNINNDNTPYEMYGDEWHWLPMWPVKPDEGANTHCLDILDPSKMAYNPEHIYKINAKSQHQGRDCFASGSHGVSGTQ